MGFALAEEATRQGAEVILVAGPVALETPHGVARIDVETTKQMLDAVLEALDRATIVIGAAAVSDYRMAASAAQKIKREKSDHMSLELVRNPDIIATVGERKGTRTVVGFAAETENLVEHARRKLVQKSCDLIVANDVSRADIGFESDENEVAIIGPDPNDLVRAPRAPKRDVAARILARIVEVRGP
jgi:phosphopantothenoylcysteine decarboxylase/phosphopantothenate--cysteine ligase